MRYFIELSYNGGAYHGWQRQPNSVTVQQTIENALSMLLGDSIEITGAGRTDTGVHAEQMYAHFDFENTIDTGDLTYRLNAFLPKDIAVKHIQPVPDDAHARFDAERRTYRYDVVDEKDVFRASTALYYKPALDIELMNRSSASLLDYEDFECFAKAHSDVKTYNCKLYEASWERKGHVLSFTISADRFLRNMVRAVVGTLLEIGSGKRADSDLSDIIASKNRSEAGASAPAHGLFLQNIVYPKSILPHE